ncbi:MAG: 2-C-methyl-D-erythritol 4-phosphate cytidylyltransferase [Myxococcales bacterium]|nr:2-C-methyl-D-erythritol 4-phosphate cytidylyltransferase [Myxococcales bacterium]
MTTAIILAGGAGTRFGAERPKQMAEILGRPVMAFTLDAFHRATSVREVIVVCHADLIPEVERLVERERFFKVVAVIEGGASRQASSHAGLREAQARGATYVLVHDAARPLVAPEVIDEASARVVEAGVVDVCAKTTDTIVRSHDGVVQDVPDRAQLYNGQTPQGFRLDLALAAHEHALADGIRDATDDIQLALRIGHRAVIVDGGPHNIKITHPSDLEIARLLLEKKLGRSKVVRLTRPFAFDEREVVRPPDLSRVAVRPLLGAICAADLRYYAGARSADALRKKLPMALLHEGVGEIVFSPVPELAPGTRVVIVPNLRRCTDPACPACTNPRIGENYCPQNAFLSSGEDGLMQSLVELDAGNVVAIPEDVPSHVAVMTELLSIATGAIRRIDPPTGDICVVGAGPVGYATQVVASELYEHPVTLCGHRDPVSSADLYFEAAGGTGAESAIREIIAAARPGATIVLLGVSELEVPISTRLVLEKGLRLIGCSRSSPADHRVALALMRRPHVAAKVERLAVSQRFQLSRVREAFDFALARSQWGKVLIDLTA